MMAKGCKFSVFHQILIDAHILFSPKISPTRPKYLRGAKDKKIFFASGCQKRPGCKLSKELMYPVKMLLLCKIENEQIRPSVYYAKDWLDHSFPFPGLVWSEIFFTLDLIIRGQATTIFLCIGPFSAWSRTTG